MANSSSTAASSRMVAGRLGALWSLIFRFVPPRWSQYIRRHWAGQRLVIALPYLWLILFFLFPLLIVLKISFATSAPTSRVPYEPVFMLLEQGGVRLQLIFDSYKYLFTEPLYVSAWIYSVKLAAVSTFLCLLIGYPMAYAIARSSPTMRSVYLMLVILPFWTSFLLRVYAWIGLLKNDGVINNVLQGIGVISEPIPMMNTSFAVYIGIVYSYLPFMILPLYSNLEKHDMTLLEAAQDLGAGPFKSFLRITLPLSVPGIVAGSLLVFIPAVGEYVIPTLLGSKDEMTISRLLYDEFFAYRNWPNAAAATIAMLALLVVPIVIFQHYQGKEMRAAHK